MRKIPVRLRPAAFTLVELLVSMAVLTILVVMVVQLVNATTKSTGASSKRLNADGQARMIFDRMALDFDRIVKRKDVDYVFFKNPYQPPPSPSPAAAPANGPGNDWMFFYSEAPGYYTATGDQGTVALIGYRINPNNAYYPNIPVLERLGKSLSWDVAPSASPADAPVYLTFPPASAPAAAGATPTPTPTPFASSTLAGHWPNIATPAPALSSTTDNLSTDPNFQVIGEQVYRLEFVFQLSDGTLSNVPYLSYHSSVNGLADVNAIVVAIALLDSASQKIVPSYQAMVSALPDPTAADLSSSPPKLMATTWSNAVNSATFAATAGIPQAAASQVRIYQRYFYLNK